MVFDFLRRKREAHLPTEVLPDEALPEELERFRMRKREETSYTEPAPETTSEYAELPAYGEDVAVETPQPILPEPLPSPERTDDRIELILQKLETIDTRLKLIEERLRR